jgi:hypothetical protein
LFKKQDIAKDDLYSQVQVLLNFLAVLAVEASSTGRERTNAVVNEKPDNSTAHVYTRQVTP